MNNLGTIILQNICHFGTFDGGTDYFSSSSKREVWSAYLFSLKRRGLVIFSVFAPSTKVWLGKAKVQSLAVAWIIFYTKQIFPCRHDLISSSYFLSSIHGLQQSTPFNPILTPKYQLAKQTFEQATEAITSLRIAIFRGDQSPELATRNSFRILDGLFRPSSLFRNLPEHVLPFRSRCPSYLGSCVGPNQRNSLGKRPSPRPRREKPEVRPQLGKLLRTLSRGGGGTLFRILGAKSALLVLTPKHLQLS